MGEKALNREEKIINDKIIDMTEQRGYAKSLCPSEVARAPYPENWRAKMSRVRERAYVLQKHGAITITQQHQDIEFSAVKGPIRLIRK